jgi:hypothetical protein
VKFNDETKFYGRTANKDYFRSWPVQPRVQYGDRYETPYIPSTSRFDGTTTNSLTYTGRQLPGASDSQREPAGRRTSRPGQKNVSLSALPESNPRNFLTAYNSDFEKPSPVRYLNRSQAAMLLSELRKRKRQSQAGSVGVKGSSGDGGRRQAAIKAF